MASPTTRDWGNSDMPSLADLIRMGKQYIGDAMPGGALNQEVTGQSVLDGVATALTPVPLVGDVAGLAADAYRYKTDPESRTPLNFGLSALGALPFIPSMTAWHGSPHKFDKFSLDKIGTGEGAQAYGHGLYLAEAPEVAQAYANKLTTVNGQAVSDQLDGRVRYLNMLKQQAADGDVNAAKNVPVIEKSIAELKNQGSLYKTDIPDEAVARFLDWDKPLSQQAPEVQAYAEKVLASEMQAAKSSADGWGDLSAPFSLMDEMTGSQFLQRLRDGKATADNIIGGGGADVSNALRQGGIPGIRYLDGGSRSAGQGSSNVVAFDPEMIRILERNGQATGLEPWKPGEYRLKDLIGKE